MTAAVLGQRTHHAPLGTGRRRLVEVHDAAGDHRASAEVITAFQGCETAVVVVHTQTGHAVPGLRRALIDTVLATPEVLACVRLAATVPLGDAESLQELTGRFSGVTVHAAGATALIDLMLADDRSRNA